MSKHNTDNTRSKRLRNVTSPTLLVDMHCFDDPLSQGTTTHLRGLYTRLPKLSPDITFLFAARDIEKLKRIFGEAPNIRYVRLRSESRIWRLSLEFSWLIKKHKVTAAHFQYVGPIFKTCKTIITLHDILFKDYEQLFPARYRLSKGPAFEMAAKSADLLCVVSEYTRSRIINHYDIPREEIAVVPNGVEPEFFSQHVPRLAELPEKYILYVSRIEPRKNHRALVEAFGRLDLAQKGYHLVLIGTETIPTPSLYKALHELDPFSRSRVIMLPHVEQHLLVSWYRYASLFVYPTLAEGFGIPPLEAAASCCPVICNNATSMTDFSFFGSNLIDINNRQLLDNKIMENLKQPSYNLKETAQEIHQLYNWDHIARNITDPMRKLLFNNR